MAHNREKWNKTIKARIANNKAAVLEQLRKMPILQVALERVHVSRSTYYHWRDKDKRFAQDADSAITEGEALITDMSESQLISLIRDKHFPAVQLWLRQHHPAYRNRLEVSATPPRDELTPEQETVVREALRLASLHKSNEQDETDEQNNESEHHTN